MQGNKATHSFKEGQRVNGHFRQYDELQEALNEGYLEFECIETLDDATQYNGKTFTVFYLITKEQNMYILRKYMGKDSNQLPMKRPSYASSSNEFSDGQLSGLVTSNNINLRPFRWYPNIAE
jgi:hypothetical protein